MRHLLTMTALGACGLVMAGCATTDNYASACERDYAENRNRAMAAGALLGGAIGAATANTVLSWVIDISGSDRTNRPRPGPFPHQGR